MSRAQTPPGGSGRGSASAPPECDIAIAGGGAAGFFAAVTAVERSPDASILLLEKSPELLAKVTISGGGRCNVTHAEFDPDRLAEHYPRGARELRGPLHRWQPGDTIDWFEARGVPLKTEADGRVFPTDDRAASITGCLLDQACQQGVHIHAQTGLRSATRTEEGFALTLSNGTHCRARRLLLATGGNAASSGYKIAANLGHTIEPPVPSLFTFHISDPRIDGLAGVSVEHARVRAAGLQQQGALLITHWGLSGPAILRLSAWGARRLHDLAYAFSLEIDWVPDTSEEEVRDRLAQQRQDHGAAQPARHPLFRLPARLWRKLLLHAGIYAKARWSGLRSEQAERLVAELKRGRFEVTGRSLNKEEFVTCGGVRLSEVDFRTMESRVCPGLFLAGELLDIDGVTGGFNLQAAWTTGRIAGEAMAAG